MTMTEQNIRDILRGIDEHPEDWRARTLILADACREIGRDDLATLLGELACSAVCQSFELLMHTVGYCSSRSSQTGITESDWVLLTER